MNSLFKSSISLFGSFFHLPIKPWGSKSRWTNSASEAGVECPLSFWMRNHFFLNLLLILGFFKNGFLLIGVLVESQKDQCTKYFIAVIVCCLYLRVLWATRLNHDVIMSSALVFSCLKTLLCRGTQVGKILFQRVNMCCNGTSADQSGPQMPACLYFPLVCVLVRTKYQKYSLTNKVSTFWLVLTFPKDCLRVETWF